MAPDPAFEPRKLIFAFAAVAEASAALGGSPPIETDSDICLVYPTEAAYIILTGVKTECASPDQGGDGAVEALEEEDELFFFDAEGDPGGHT